MRKSYLFSFIALALGLPAAGAVAASAAARATQARPAAQPSHTAQRAVAAPARAGLIGTHRPAGAPGR